MTASNSKTKRDRAAGRRHRHTALQTIIDNHETLTTDLAEFEGPVTQRMKDMRGNIGYSMGCIVETERKVAEIEPALALLQEFSRQQSSINVTVARANELSCKTQKAQQDAIAQLNRYSTDPDIFLSARDTGDGDGGEDKRPDNELGISDGAFHWWFLSG